MFRKLRKRGIIVLVTASLGSMGTLPNLPSASAETVANAATNTLSILEVKGISLDKEFSADQLEYSATVENDVQSITLHVESNNPNGTITINGEPLTNETEGTYSLQTGANTFSISVNDGIQTANVYTLTVTRKELAEEPAPVVSTPVTENKVEEKESDTKATPTTTSTTMNVRNTSTGQGQVYQQADTSTEIVEQPSKAMLSSLTVSAGTWDSTFSADEFTYHITVPSDTETVTIHPAASYSSSSITIEDGTNKTITLDDDNKTVISVVVKYDDDDRKTYVLVFDKES
jgi:Cadherin-like beta sandwich domain